MLTQFIRHIGCCGQDKLEMNAGNNGLPDLINEMFDWILKTVGEYGYAAND